MPRALITGITGQDGLYLGELLREKGYEIFGLVRGEANPKLDLVRAVLPEATLLLGDIVDVPSIDRAFSIAQPDEVYNLAAVSSVAFSWENPGLTTDVTAKGAFNMLEATKNFAGSDVSKIRFYQASSSEIFGKAQEIPQTEKTLLWPRSPYGIAKVFGHHMTINFREAFGMHASSGILFNHESPRRGPEFVTRKISQAVARISLGLQDELVLGNLDIRRDWGFAGDYVEAMWLMTQHSEPDDYIIATGEAHSLFEFLDAAFTSAGITAWRNKVKQDPRFLRPAEVDLVVGDSSKARQTLNWEPRVSFEELVDMMVHHDLQEQRLLL